jgi:multidrug resistance efflux pump
MSKLDELKTNVALLEREHRPLEAAYQKAREAIERMERIGDASEIARVKAIAEAARIAFARCDAQLRQQKAELAASIARH